MSERMAGDYDWMANEILKIGDELGDASAGSMKSFLRNVAITMATYVSEKRGSGRLDARALYDRTEAGERLAS